MAPPAVDNLMQNIATQKEPLSSSGKQCIASHCLCYPCPFLMSSVTGHYSCGWLLWGKDISINSSRGTAQQPSANQQSSLIFSLVHSLGGQNIGRTH